jgi:hypothetical protein
MAVPSKPPSHRLVNPANALESVAYGGLDLPKDLHLL